MKVYKIIRENNVATKVGDKLDDLLNQLPLKHLRSFSASDDEAVVKATQLGYSNLRLAFFQPYYRIVENPLRGEDVNTVIVDEVV